MIVTCRATAGLGAEHFFDGSIGTFLVDLAHLQNDVLQKGNRETPFTLEPSVRAFVKIPVAEQRAEWAATRSAFVYNVGEALAGESLERISKTDQFVDDQVCGVKVDQLVSKHVQLDQDSDPRIIQTIGLFVVVCVIVHCGGLIFNDLVGVHVAYITVSRAARCMAFVFCPSMGVQSLLILV